MEIKSTYRVNCDGSSILAILDSSDIAPDTSWKKKHYNSKRAFFKELNCKEAYRVLKSGVVELPNSAGTIDIDSSVANLKVIDAVLTAGIIFRENKNKILANCGFKNPTRSQFMGLGISETFSAERGYEIFKGNWFAFDSQSFDDLYQALSEIGFCLDNTSWILSYRQYLKCKKHLSRRGIPFVESFQQEEFLIHLKKQSKEKNLQIPTNINFELYPYQKKALKWLQFCYENELGCILADDMGLGKTKTVIALLAHANKGPNVVVCPSTLLINWARELSDSCPAIKFKIYHGQHRFLTESRLKDTQLIITSYGTFKNDFTFLSNISWNVVVLDEAQKIKNPETDLRNVINQTKFRLAIAVTGTPFENKPGDLWSLMDFIEPGFLGTRESFERQYGQPILSGDKGAEASLEKKISLFMLRRLKKEVLKELPEKIEINQPIEMNSFEVDNYRKQIEEMKGKGENNFSYARPLVYLRQICCHPLLTSSDENFDPLQYCNKYQRLVEILSQVFQYKEKVLIFTSFHKMNDIICNDIRFRFNVPTFQLDGRVPPSKRFAPIDDFSNIKGSAVMVLNPIVGGVGINLIAANHVVHYNREWNPAIENQATDRVYRIGQKNKVFIHYLYYVDTIDEIITDRLNEKMELANSLVRPSGQKEQDKDIILKALKLVPKRNQQPEN